MTDETALVNREENGQFQKGKSGNPAGRPPKTRKGELTNLKQEMELAIRQHLTVDRVKRIVDRIAKMAEEGNIPAAKLILDKLVPNARDTEDAPDPGTAFVFRIENATFAAREEKPQVTVQIVDATVEEVK